MLAVVKTDVFADVLMWGREVRVDREGVNEQDLRAHVAPARCSARTGYFVIEGGKMAPNVPKCAFCGC